MAFSASTNNELLIIKSRCAELELSNAHLKDEVHSIHGQKSELEDQVKSLLQRLASQSTSQFQEELFASQKEVLRLTDHKASLEQQLEKENETIQLLHKNIAREVQKSKDEVERQSIFLRSQILEQKEINTTLQEKLMTALQVSKQLDNEGMHDNITEAILITSDAVLQKFRQEHRNNVKGKYDVHVDITGRSLVLSGRKVNVQLLKAEIMSALNDAYCALVDPTKYVSAAKAKEEASKHEIDHLRRTVLTHETTIQSLHVALQHSQDTYNGALTAAEEANRKSAVMQTQFTEHNRIHARQIADFEEKIRELNRQIVEGQESSRMALHSLRADADVAAQYRAQLEELREEVRRITDLKELAERSVYVTTRQLEMTREQLQDAIRSDVSVADLTRRLEHAEHRSLTVDQRVAEARRDSKDHEQKLTIEIGTLQERLRRSIDEGAQTKKDLQNVSVERDAARAELQQSRDIIHEMRNKMVHLSVLSLTNQEGGLTGTSSHHGRSGSPQGHSAMESILVGSEKHMMRIEEENGALRTELQHAFEDMRAVATSLKETRVVRERALEDVQRLESEKGRLFEERQKVERQIIEDRMASRQRESELELQVLALRDELQHQQKRIEMLHAEYQRKIENVMQDASARLQQQSGHDEFAANQLQQHVGNHSMTRPGTNSFLRRTSRPGEVMQPNDASLLPQRTPKSNTTMTALQVQAARPQSSAGVFTLRSSSHEQQAAGGLVSTPRNTASSGVATPTSGFRLSAARPAASHVDLPLESPPR